MPTPVRSLDLAELRAFCAAVDLGSLGRAARLLRVSQPALSKRMRTIETVVGTPLVERSPRGILPTPAGEKLYVEARKLLAQAEGGGDPVGRPRAGSAGGGGPGPARGEPHDRRVRAARPARGLRAPPRPAPV